MRRCIRHPDEALVFALDEGEPICLVCQDNGGPLAMSPEGIEAQKRRAREMRRNEYLRAEGWR